jgi:ankyrin repeat protein
MEHRFVAAAANSNFTLMTELLASGVSVNAMDPMFGGRLALNEAARLGLKKVVAFLIDHHASLDAVDGIGLTALMHACSKGKKKGGEIAQLLVRSGAKVGYVRESDGMTALKFALWGGCSEEVINELLSHGAKPPEAGFKVVRLV